MLDTKGNVRSWNSGAERIKQYSANEIIGRNFSAFYTAEDVASGEPVRALAQAAATGKYIADGWRVRKDGSRFWASVVLDALHDPLGQIVGYVKITRDETVRREQENRLRTSEETFRLAMEHEPIGKALVAPDGRWIKANSALCQILGYTEEELMTLSFQDLTHPEDLQADLELVQRLVEGDIHSY